jgi:hypothetical protein
MGWGRGALAGSVIALTVWVVDCAIANLITQITHPPRWPVDTSWYETGLFVVVIFVLVGACVAVPLGAVLGVLMAWADRMLYRSTSSAD